MRALLLALLLPLAACGADADREGSAPEAASEASGETGYGGPIRGEIAVVETSDEGEIEVGVTSEVMFFRLGESARAEVEKELEAESEAGGIGGAISDMVGGVVTKALATTVQMPLEQVQDVRYENGNLIVEGEGSSFSFGDNNSADSGIPFDADAAERIIDAYNASR